MNNVIKIFLIYIYFCVITRWLRQVITYREKKHSRFVYFDNFYSHLGVLAAFFPGDQFLSPANVIVKFHRQFFFRIWEKKVAMSRLVASSHLHKSKTLDNKYVSKSSLVSLDFWIFLGFNDSLFIKFFFSNFSN